MNPKTAIITGATGAIGQAIAVAIASKGFRTVIAARNENKARKCREEIIGQSGNAQVEIELVDLSHHASIKDFRARWKGPLDILVNCAAQTPRQRLETPEGIEMQFATNVLGYFWMMSEFADCLELAGNARVVNVASYWAGDLDMNDLEFHERPYNNNTAYRQSKQADRMLTIEFADRLRDAGVLVNACHPGDVNSKLSNDLGFGGHESPAKGAQTPVWLASEPGLTQSGAYFEHQQLANCRFMSDRQQTSRLFEICKAYSNS